MEIRARYLTIGLFTLAVIAAGFVFVYWLYNAGGLGRRDAYQIRFQGSVAGLAPGSPVTFNGLRIGEVTTVTLNPANPSDVLVAVGVAAGTPVRMDTKVAMEFQGLTGSPAVALVGGSATAQAYNLAGGEPPTLIADAEASRSMTESARAVMQKLDGVLSDNADPLKATLGNLKTFTDALSRNSDRVDGILSGLERMTGGGSKKALGFTVDLTAPRNFKPLAHVPPGQLAVPEPTTTGKLDTDKLSLDPIAPAASEQAQWADVLPKLIQSRLVQSFENAGLIGSVIRGGDNGSADYQLQTDVRNFHVVGTPALAAEFEISAKMLNDKGRILAGRIFRNSVALANNDPQLAANGLDQAFGGATVELVDWATSVLTALPAKPAEPAPAQ